MGRKPRVQGDGVIYHVVNRGNNKEYILKSENDKESFLLCLEKAKIKYDYRLLSYAIMDNHYHLLMQTMEEGKISQIMHHIHCGYGRYYKRVYGRTGHVFQGRYRSEIIDSEVYLLEASKYIHLNPCRAKIVDHPIEYKYSSLPILMGHEHHPLLEIEDFLGIMAKDLNASRKIYLEYLLGE